jgi:simple sugar transport system permease protein
VLISEGIKIGIDLSVGSTASLGAVLFATLIVAEVPLPIAIFVVLLVGIAIGFFNGMLVVKFGILPFVATVGTMFIVRSLEMISNQGWPIFPEMGKSKGAYLFIYAGNIGSFPFVIILVAIIFIILYLLLYQSGFGINLFAAGFNNNAAITSGIRTARYRFSAYVISGILAVLAGILIVSRLSGAPVHVGEPLLMDAIAAAFIGTVITNDRRPSLVGSLIGAFLLVALINGFTFLNVNYFYISILKGLILIVVISTAALTKKR